MAVREPRKSLFILAAAVVIGVLLGGAWLLLGRDEARVGRPLDPAPLVAAPGPSPVPEAPDKVAEVIARSQELEQSQSVPVRVASETVPANRMGTVITGDGEEIDAALFPVPRGMPVPVLVPFKARLYGRVLTTDQAPLPNAAIVAQVPAYGGTAQLTDGTVASGVEKWRSLTIAPHAPAMSGVDGKWELLIEGTCTQKFLDAGGPTFQVAASLDGWSQVAVPNRPSKGAPGQIELEVDIYMARPAVIRGVAVNLYTGELVPGASVGAEWLAAPEGVRPPMGRWNDPGARVERPAIVRRVIAGPDGAFELTGVAEGMWRLAALPPGVLAREWRRDYQTLATDAESVTINVPAGIGTLVRVPVTPPGALVFSTDPAVTVPFRTRLMNAHQVTLDRTQPIDAVIAQGDLRETTIGEDGRHRIEGVLPRHGGLVLVTSGYAPQLVRFPTITAALTDLGTIRLSEGLSLTGTVEDSRGAAVSGAAVMLKWHSQFAGSPFGYEERTKALADGTFRVTGLTPGKWMVVASLDGMAGEPREVVLSDRPVAPVRLVLYRPGTILGTVTVPPGTTHRVNRDGQGNITWSQCTVAVVRPGLGAPSDFRAGPGERMEVDWGFLRPARVGEDMTFRFDGLPPGKYFLGCWHLEEKFVKEVDLTEGGVARVDFEMGQRGTVEGTVTGPDGKPLGGAVVLLCAPTISVSPESGTTLRGVARATAVSGMDGSYQLPNVPPGKHRVWVEGYEHLYGQHDKQHVVDVGPGGIVRLDINLEADSKHTLRGRWHMNGKPVFTQMLLSSDRSVKPYINRSLHPDGEGWFRAGGLVPGSYEGLLYGWVEEQRYGFSTYVRFEIGAMPRETVIDESISAGDLTGTVRSSSLGVSYKDAEVRVTPRAKSGELLHVNGSFVTLAPEGEFRFPLLVAGDYHVEITVPGFPTVIREVQVGPGTRLDVPLPDRAGKLAIRIASVQETGDTSPGNLSMGAVMVELRDRAWTTLNYRRVRDDSASRTIAPGAVLTLEGVAAGDVRVIVMHSLYEVVERDVLVRPGESLAIDVDLRAAALVSLRLPDREWTKEQRSQVTGSLHWTPPGRTIGRPSYDGSSPVTDRTSWAVGGSRWQVSFPICRPGEVRVALSDGLGGSFERTLTVASGEKVTVDVDFTAAGSRGSGSSEVKQRRGEPEPLPAPSASVR